MPATALSQGPESRLPATVAAALRQSGIPVDSVAIQVQEVGAAAPRLAVNANRAFNPASVMKLLTTFAALELLGPAHTWKTEAWAAGAIEDGILQSDLHLRGSGDPKLSFEQFWLLLRQLRARGLRDIRGDLVLDRSAFDLPAHDPTAFDGQGMRPYNVGPDALLVSFDAIRLSLTPNPERKLVQVAVEPEPASLDVVNLLRLGNNGCSDWKEGLRADVTRHAERYRLVLTGSYSASCGAHQWNLAVMPQREFAAGVFTQLWRELGGSFAGGVRDGPLPDGAQQLATLESPALAEIVRDINKFSNNVMARQLYLTLGLESGRRPARPEDGEAALRAWLEARGLRFPELVLENGAGLSRRERIAAASLGRLLQEAWRSPTMPEFIASLPLVATDGTMRKRLNGNGVAGQAHIKTGSLEGVKAIAGYVLDRNGRRHAVVFMVNHPNAGASQAAQDALLQWVFDGGNG